MKFRVCILVASREYGNISHRPFIPIMPTNPNKFSVYGGSTGWVLGAPGLGFVGFRILRNHVLCCLESGWRVWGLWFRNGALGLGFLVFGGWTRVSCHSNSIHQKNVLALGPWTLRGS